METEQLGTEPFHGQEASISDEEVEQITEEDEEQQIQQAANRFLEFLENRPEAFQTFNHIFEKHLQGEINTETGRLLFNSISIYAGEDNAEALWTFMRRGFHEPDFLTKIEGYFNEKVRTFFRSFLALYGSKFQEVYALQDENPNGWRFLQRRIYYNLTEEKWQIELKIFKYNGEMTLYEDLPIGWLNLAYLILSILNEIPSEAAPEIIRQDVLEKFRNTCTEFFELFTIKPTETNDEESKS